MQKNHFLLLKKFKNTESAQLCKFLDWNLCMDKLLLGPGLLK